MAQRIAALGVTETVEDMRAGLAELQTDLSTDHDAFVDGQARITALETDNEQLRSANMRLFTQIGVKAETKIDEPKEKRKFEDLFNDKGGLK